MLDLETVNAVLRHQRQEIETLEGTENSLVEKALQLKAFLPQKESFETTLRRLPIVREERDVLLENLKETAQARAAEDGCDVCAKYCLYLLNCLATLERTNEELEELYVQTKYGEDLVNPGNQISIDIPRNMDEITVKYGQLKDELSLAESHLAIAQKTNESVRRELDETRSRYRQMSASIPELARQLEAELAELSASTLSKEEHQKSVSGRLDTRETRVTQRTKLIDEMVAQLEPTALELPEGRQQQLLGALRSLLLSANDPAQGTDTTMMSHARALVQLSESPSIDKAPVQPRSPILPAKLGMPQRARQIKAMFSMLSPHKL